MSRRAILRGLLLGAVIWLVWAGCVYLVAVHGATQQTTDRSVTGLSILSAASPSDTYLLELHNRARQEAGAGELRMQAQLAALASSRAQELAASGYLWHMSGDHFHDECGCPEWAWGGENLGMLESWGTLDDLMAAWLASTGHRSNLLSPLWRHVGIGTAYGADGRLFAAVVFSQ